MTRRQTTGPASAEEVSKGCRRIVGFLFAGWFLFGLLFSFLGDGGFGDRVPFGIAGILNFAIPIAIFAFVFALVAKRSRDRSRAGEDEIATPPVPSRRVESMRTEPTRPVQSPPPPAPLPPPTPSRAPPTPSRAPDPTPETPPQTLEQALEELGLEPSESAIEKFDLELDSRPRSSQEMIDEARRKWGKDRDR